MADPVEKREIRLSRVSDHECFEGFDRFVERHFIPDLFVHIGLDAFLVCLFPHRFHNEKCQNQRQRNQKLGGRRLLGSQRLTQKGEYDDKTNEARHDEYQRRGQDEKRQNDDDIECVDQIFGFGGRAHRQIDRRNIHRSEQWNDQKRERYEKKFHFHADILAYSGFKPASRIDCLAFPSSSGSFEKK